MGKQKTGEYSYNGQRIFLDQNAYEILKTIRNAIKHQGTRGASFSDTVRYLKEQLTPEQYDKLIEANKQFLKEKEKNQ